MGKNSENKAALPLLLWWHCSSFVGRVTEILILLVLQSRFGDKLLRIIVVSLQKRNCSSKRVNRGAGHILGATPMRQTRLTGR